MLPSAYRDVRVQQLQKSRPPAANRGVMEAFVFSSSPAGGEQHLRVETGVGHVVVALVNDPGEGESVNRAFVDTGLESGGDIFQASPIFRFERGGGPSIRSLQRLGF
jgi:hypothetical protein